MFAARSTRWGGLAAILGGVLVVVAAGLVPSFGPPSLDAENPALPPYEVAVLSSVVWGPFVVAGLAGLCASVAGRPGAGRVLAVGGLAIGAIAVFVPLVLVVQAALFGGIFFPPSLSALVVLELWGLALATVLVGVAVLLSSRAPWGLGLLAVALGAAMLLGAPQAAIGLGWALLGYGMWSSQEEGIVRRVLARRAGTVALGEPRPNRPDWPRRPVRGTEVRGASKEERA